MVCNRFKGGIGTSSRVLPAKDGGYIVGVLVQCNYGSRQNVRVAGVPVGREINSEDPYAYQPPPISEQDSIIIVVVTNAPLLPTQLKRLAHRVTLGLGHGGSISGNDSGDIFIAFSTANSGASSATKPVDVKMVPNDSLDPIFCRYRRSNGGSHHQRYDRRRNPRPASKTTTSALCPTINSRQY